ncbi:MAG: prolyl oligopeptidase family serine peptidase, partial [Planctomycetota bacterium]
MLRRSGYLFSIQRFNFCLALLTGLFLGAITNSYAQTPAAQPLTAEQREKLETGRQVLQAALEKLLLTQPAQLVADAGLYAKGVEWALKYDRDFTPGDIALLEKALARGQERVAAVANQQAAWPTKQGKLALAYTSAVDGSVQPYGLIVPKNYDAEKPIRLDVVLHGSSKPIGLSELRFVSRFDTGDAADTTAPDQPFIELHPLGRVENCYRWAGEADVFEAIEDVCRRYKIDRDRIVLRGMSMGASGTWHLGLKHPDRFVALGPYCGYVDTHKFSQTPLPGFVKIDTLPEPQELGLHMIDSIDYAANAGIVPAIACMGEKDIFFEAHVLMGNAMQREGLQMVNLISPGTGHVIDPVTQAEQLRRIAEYSTKGLNHHPADLRFVTWTLKYGRAHWLQLQGLERHYARAELRARVQNHILEIAEPTNITRFRIATSELPGQVHALRIGSLDLPLPTSTGKPPAVIISKQDNQWSVASEPNAVPQTGKRPGLQGPIDDAFTAPFLCVRGTGTPWNPAVQAYSDASLARFSEEWHHYMRGALPIKDDMAVTADDLRTRNLILFGDPGSNSWI